MIERELNCRKNRKFFDTKTFYTRIFLNTKISPTMVYMYTLAHLRPGKVLINWYYGDETHIYQLLSPSHKKAVEVHGCKSSLTNLTITPHTLGTLTANITYTA